MHDNKYEILLENKRPEYSNGVGRLVYQIRALRDTESVALFVKQYYRPYDHIVYASTSERSILEVVKYLMEVGGDLYEDTST